MEYTWIEHPFPPLYDAGSTVLILGSFPSVKSREQRFYYGHPQNRFWKVMGRVFEEPVPETIDEKKAFLHRNHIALWDSIFSCEIRGSSDSSIRNAIPTDLFPVLQASRIRAVFCNGNRSGEMYRKYQEERLGLPAIVLPSTSPANAAWSVERLAVEWRILTRI